MNKHMPGTMRNKQQEKLLIYDKKRSWSYYQGNGALGSAHRACPNYLDAWGRPGLPVTALMYISQTESRCVLTRCVTTKSTSICRCSARSEFSPPRRIVRIGICRRYVSWNEHNRGDSSVYSNCCQVFNVQVLLKQINI